MKQIYPPSTDIMELQKEYDALMAKANGLLYAINLLKEKGQVSKDTNSKQTGNYEAYDQNATIKNKLRFLLKAEQRFLHIREMATTANKLEPSVSVDDFLKKFSPALSALKTEKKIINIRIGRSQVNTFWGSEKWLDEHGMPKKGYEYNPAYLNDNNKEDEDEL